MQDLGTSECREHRTRISDTMHRCEVMQVENGVDKSGARTRPAVICSPRVLWSDASLVGTLSLSEKNNEAY